MLFLIPYIPGAVAATLAYGTGAYFLDGFLGGSAASLAAVGAYQGATYLSETIAASAFKWVLEKVGLISKEVPPNA